MCGIIAVLSGNADASPPSLEELLGRIEALVGFSLMSSSPAEGLGRAGELLKHSSLWVRPEGFLSVFSGASEARRMEEAAGRLEKWLGELELHLESESGLTMELREQANQLLTMGMDAAWQIKEDVLSNIPKVRSLLPGAGLDEVGAFKHAWTLNLILNNIDRLEVRGRDSAGIASYIRFRSREDVDGFLREAGRGAELARRSQGASFSHSNAIVPSSAPNTLLFAFKIAQEVGEMGQNVRFLRDAVAKDALFQAALRHPGVEVQTLGHTRWASNGVVSIPNCHPVDSTVLKEREIVRSSHGSVVAALNGDVDNFQELIKKYVFSKEGAAVDPAVTTDAKIIPLVVQAMLENSGSLEEAFERALDEFDGSMAICLMAADKPGEFICAQKGSGQGLFLGFAEGTTVVASEMYGLVELTSSYVKAQGERKKNGRTVGEIFRVAAPDDGGVTLLPGHEPLEESRVKKAEITTRDINRGQYPRFLLKEIFESVLSVRKTIRGKVFIDETAGRAGTLLDESVLPQKLKAALKAGEIKRIIPTGQGTAAVAAQGIGHLFEAVLKDASIAVTPMKATELSGHSLKDDMKDCLVVAVSQSGTTTDTNRTVDLVRERGAKVIGIVNRRNSDLVYKSDGVLYTSDGRDIEMSVASTKAFYAQNVAGQILALALAETLEVLSNEEMSRKLSALLELPALLKKVLDLSPLIERVAKETALRRRYWAVVGTGASKVAADEIRIKLSELCYKAIAVDFLEDKKHIDLSSEPLIIVCASSLPPATVSDEVKEVAIFKAHSSLPIVIVDEGEHRFDPYADYLVPVPRCEGELSYLLPTMVGHLYGYYAASAFDRYADRMRKLRLNLVKQLEDEMGEGGLGGTELWKLLARSEEITEETLALQQVMMSGEIDSGIEVGTATRLSMLLDFLLGRIPLDAFMHRFEKPGTLGNLLAELVEQLTKAVNELCRPIDAIKHQAKTVTVGISRQVERPAGGPLWPVFAKLGLDETSVTAGHGNMVSALEPLISGLQGATLYKVEGLTPIGKPVYTSTIVVEAKSGCTSDIQSRCETRKRLSGTKWGVVTDGRLFLGRGQKDGRHILIVPVLGQRSEGRLLLFHIELKEKGPREARMAALKALQDRYKQILISVTEATDREWSPEMIDKLSNEQLFFEDPKKLGKLLR